MDIETFEAIVTDLSQGNSEIYRYILFGNYTLSKSNERISVTPEDISVEERAAFLHSEEVTELIEKHRPDFLQSFMDFKRGYLRNSDIIMK